MPSDEGTLKQRGEFFRLDLNAFRQACLIGSINCAAAYLLLARGTGGDNTYTSWSAEALNNRTSISWPKAKLAMHKLAERGLIAINGTARKPRYELLRQESREPLTTAETKALKLLAAQKNLTPAQTAAIERARLKGWLEYEKGSPVIVDKPPIKAAWLPNAIIDGVPGERDNLLNRLIKTRDPITLALLAELYALHDLPEHDGIPANIIWRSYDRKKEYSASIYDLWKFSALDQAYHSHSAFPFWTMQNFTDPETGSFWKRLQQLEQARAFYWVPTLFEGSDEDAQPVMPLLCDDSDMPQDTLGLLANIASHAIRYGADASLDRVHEFDNELTVPIERLSSQMIVKSVVRLTYRPRTQNSARWYADYARRCSEFAATFQALARSHAPHLLVQENDIKVA